jgi:hypothetical protein
MKKKGEPSIRRVQTTCVVVILLYNNATKSPEWTITGGYTQRERQLDSRRRRRFYSLDREKSRIDGMASGRLWFPVRVSSLHLSRFGHINSYELLVFSVFLFDHLVEGQHISIIHVVRIIYFESRPESNKSPWWSPRQLGSTQKGRREIDRRRRSPRIRQHNITTPISLPLNRDELVTHRWTLHISSARSSSNSSSFLISPKIWCDTHTI